MDDELSILDTLVEVLTHEGYDVLTARDGREALEVIAREPPDAVLLDVMMPYLDGREVRKRLRASPQTAALPIVMMTAAPLEASPGEALLRKPFELDTLLSVLEALY